jgi:hypothetical protein
LTRIELLPEEPFSSDQGRVTEPAVSATQRRPDLPSSKAKKDLEKLSTLLKFVNDVPEADSVLFRQIIWISALLPAGRLGGRFYYETNHSKFTVRIFVIFKEVLRIGLGRTGMYDEGEPQ